MSEYRGGVAEEVWLLREMLRELRESLKEQRKTNRVLRRIECELLPPQVQSFTLTIDGDYDMATNPIIPGVTVTITATTVPAGSTLPSGVLPVWTSSDSTNAPVTVDSTGLIGTVVLSGSIANGESVTITATATLPDGTAPTGSVTFTVGSSTPTNEVTGFTLTITNPPVL